jgi:hypothetical protein
VYRQNALSDPARAGWSLPVLDLPNICVKNPQVQTTRFASEMIHKRFAPAMIIHKRFESEMIHKRFAPESQQEI